MQGGQKPKAKSKSKGKSRKKESILSSRFQTQSFLKPQEPQEALKEAEKEAGHAKAC